MSNPHPILSKLANECNAIMKSHQDMLDQAMSINPQPIVDMGSITFPDFEDISVKLSHAEVLLLAAFEQLKSNHTTQCQAETAQILVVDALRDVRELKEMIYPTVSIKGE